MKPRNSRLLHSSLPALIVVSAFAMPLHAVSNKTIVPNAAGDVTVAGNYDELNGADWTVLASGGNASPFVVNIQQGASLTGDVGQMAAVIVSSGNYTINNSGTLNTQSYGIYSYAGDTIVNNLAGGSIRGAYDGVSFSRNRKIPVFDTLNGPVEIDVEGGTLVNDGIIIGDSNGVSGGSNVIVENHATGEITGNRGNGILAGENLVLRNEGKITGGALGGIKQVRFTSPVPDIPIFYRESSGVSAYGSANITNTGSIIGKNGHGVSTRGELVLTNSGIIEGNGMIRQIDDLDNIAPIIEPQRFYGIGITTWDNSVINNLRGGTISGTDIGISAWNNLVLTNAGTISGSSEQGGNAGVQTGDGSLVNNSGVILGDKDGIVISMQEIQGIPAIFNNEEEQDPTSTIINNGGSITGTSGSGILGSDKAQIVLNSNGSINGGASAITLGGGDDRMDFGFGSVVNGDINGGAGMDVINFTSGSTDITQPSNIVHGNVFGIETINKTGTGFAFIGGPGESFNVFTDTINVSSGGLVINGNLASLSEGKTIVNLSNGGRLDGTGNWNADITVTNGGISAGGTNNLLDDEGVAPLGAKRSQPVSNAGDSVGTLTLNGNFNMQPVVIDPPFNPLPLAKPVTSTYLREDIKPQTPIKDGINSDLIIQKGAGNSFNVAGMDVRIAPTDINKTLTDGTYTMVDSESPLVGFGKIGAIGVQLEGSAPDTGDFIASESGEDNRNTVLGKYFASLDTSDPNAQQLTKAAGNPNDTNLLLKIKHNFKGLPGLSANQSAFGAALDAEVKSPNPLIQDFIAALDYSSLGAVQATLATLDPANSMGLASSVVNSSYRLHRLTQDHLANVRGSGQEIVSTAPDTTDAKGVVVPGETSTRLADRANAWGSLSYDGQDYDTAGSSADFDGDSGSFTAGFDWLVAPQLVLGIVLDGSKGDYDGQGTSSKVDSFRGAIYGTWGSSLGFYSDALIGYGNHSLDSKVGPAGVLAAGSSSDTDADGMQAMWTAGYAMGSQSLKHGPFAGLEYQNLEVNDYTQTGPLPISVGGYDINSLRALIGYRANANLGTFRPYASAAYAHEFEDGATSTTASFGGAPFRVTGADQASAILLGLGTGISISHSFTLDIGYRGDIAVEDGITSHGGSFGLNYSF
jgi:uncharacterized protein YhjY with autotransporter beta-barrel domain